jgi:hypothetical protein
LRLGLIGRVAALAGLCVAAAACDSGPSKSEILDQASRMVKPVPGLYRSVTTLSEFEMPGATAQEAGRMRERMGGIKPQEREYCLGEEEAEKGFAQMLAQSQSGSCSFSRFIVNDRRLSASMSCEGEAGYSASVEMDGMGEAQQSQMTLRIQQRGPGIAGGLLRMRLDVDSRRIGDC